MKDDPATYATRFSFKEKPPENSHHTPTEENLISRYNFKPRIRSQTADRAAATTTTKIVSKFLIRMRNSVIFRLSNWKVGVRWASGLAEASKPVKQRGCHSRMSGWQIHAYSDNVQELQLSENVRKPFIRKPTELLVKVSASSVNPFDIAVMSERSKFPESRQ